MDKQTESKLVILKGPILWYTLSLIARIEPTTPKVTLINSLCLSIYKYIYTYRHKNYEYIKTYFV